LATPFLPPSSRLPVTVLGATGVVGQRFVRRLAAHPWFEIRHLAASDQSAGKRYAEAASGARRRALRRPRRKVLAPHAAAALRDRSAP
jgi:aspartate-semialdehyde dehydrogenase